MEKPQSVRRLERHALVTAIWLAFGLMAGCLFHYGYLAGRPLFLLVGFGAVAAGFIGHVIVDAVLRSTFSQREVALGLVSYAAALVVFGLSILTVGGMSSATVLVTSAGFISLFLIVVFYMTVSLGVRRAFESFDVIREFRAGKTQESET